MKDFTFIGDEMDDIKCTSKEDYKIIIKEKVIKAAFDSYMNVKQKHSKLALINEV